MKNNEARVLTTKCQMIIWKRKSIFSKGLLRWKATTKNNKVKYSIIKQFKTQTMQTRHGLKKNKNDQGLNWKTVIKRRMTNIKNITKWTTRLFFWNFMRIFSRKWERRKHPTRPPPWPNATPLEKGWRTAPNVMAKAGL